MKDEKLLHLDEQLCFPMYATSRMITRLYQPMLDELGLTYPQYLAMLVLWEASPQTVSDIGAKLLLNSNTLTPLLKKLVEKGYITRKRSDADERVVDIILTKEGENLKKAALEIPEKLVAQTNFPVEKLVMLRTLIKEFLESLPK